MTGDRIARAQEFVDGITDADFEAAWGTLVMVGVCVVPALMLAGLAFVLWLVFGSHWGSVAGVFLFVAAFFSVGACCVWREDHR